MASAPPPAPAPLDTDKAERKVWIVRVPPYVAKQWHQAIAAAATAAVDEDAQPEVLGQVTIEQGQASTLLVPGAGPGEGPQLLHMNGNRDSVDTAIISYEPGAQGAVQAPRVDGVAFKRFDAGPVKIAELPSGDPGPASLDPEQVKRQAEERQRQAAAAQAQVDAGYLQNSRKRLQEAARAGPGAGRHKLAMLDDMSQMRQLAGGTKDMPLWTRKGTAKAAVTLEPKAKRVRMSRDELEEKLFELFGKQPHLHFAQIQKAVDQPIAFLKEVLNDLAIQIKRGPNKDMWELKKVYKSASQRQQQQQAGGGGAGGAG